jgi:hypothetical protein
MQLQVNLQALGLAPSDRRNASTVGDTAQEGANNMDMDAACNTDVQQSADWCPGR